MEIVSVVIQCFIGLFLRYMAFGCCFLTEKGENKRKENLYFRLSVFW